MLSFFLCQSNSFGDEKMQNKNGEQTTVQSLQIVSSPELYDLSSAWVSSFRNLHSESKIDLSCQAEEFQLKDGNLYLSANQYSEGNGPGWEMVIGHDLVVPIINLQNPFLKEINKKGFTADDFAQLVSENADWSMVISEASKSRIHCYIADNQQVIANIARFTKTDVSSVRGKKVNTSAELISLIQNDVNSIGFCRLPDVLNPGENSFIHQIGIIPVDKNKNGRIDSFENIYSTPEALTRGAWIGKYPGELCGEIFALANVKPTNQTALDFMAFVNSEGQDNIKKSGYSVLSSVEKTANLLVLTNPVPSAEPGSKSQFDLLSWILVIGSIALIVISIILLIFKRSKTLTIDSDDIEITPALNENSIQAPRGLYYDKTHTWTFMEQDGLVKIGVDDFIKHVTGSITQLKMKEQGEKVRKGEKILTVIRNGKHLNLYSPVSGYIRKQNTFLSDAPAKINILSFTDAWVYQVEPTNWKREAGFMFMFDKYREWLEDEFIRLKDFLALSANSNSLVYEHIVMQDGGELKDNVLADLGPEVWEDFQTKFIDTSK